MHLIEARGIEIRHGSQTVLSGVDMAIDRGEIVTVLGPNGSGKSSLVRALVGAMPVARGRIIRRDGLRIGYVPQRILIDPVLPLTVRRFLSLPDRVSDDAATDALDRTGVGDLRSRQMSDLSGGQLQRVLLARALIGRPDILILDEPTQGLDQLGEAAFYRLLEDLRSASGTAVLLVSHDLHVVMSASDRVICLNGHICCEGTPQIVSEAPEYRALFGTGTAGTLALYRHDHNHSHDDGHGHGHSHDHTHSHDHANGHDHADGNAGHRHTHAAGRVPAKEDAGT
ncbi:MAG: metal ABC transporter ATP-binding protein [Rhodobacteraceae bacterium]|nr:metal ABC transporter ATP-binding protein [Paracoccaceae bacterium]